MGYPPPCQLISRWNSILSNIMSSQYPYPCFLCRGIFRSLHAPTRLGVSKNYLSSHLKTKWLILTQILCSNSFRIAIISSNRGGKFPSIPQNFRFFISIKFWETFYFLFFGITYISSVQGFRFYGHDYTQLYSFTHQCHF